MQQIVSRMLESYEQSRVRRRQLIQGLAAITSGYAPASESTFQGMALNHIAIRETDVQRSRDFYQKHFGLPVIREAETNCSWAWERTSSRSSRTRRRGLTTSVSRSKSSTRMPS